MKTNAPQYLIDAARAIQCAAKHYGIPPQDVLHIDRNCAKSCRARYAVWTALHKSKGWRLIDIAAEFKISASGVGIGIQKGALLVINREWKYIECVEKVKIHLGVPNAQVDLPPKEGGDSTSDVIGG